MDDEKALVAMGEELLAELGYEVTVRKSSAEALTLFRTPPPFDLVVTDQTMPEMTGIELAKAILTIRPDMPIIMCTGFSHLVNGRVCPGSRHQCFCHEAPYKEGDPAKTVREVLDG